MTTEDKVKIIKTLLEYCSKQQYKFISHLFSSINQNKISSFTIRKKLFEPRVQIEGSISVIETKVDLDKKEIYQEIHVVDFTRINPLYIHKEHIEWDVGIAIICDLFIKDLTNKIRQDEINAYVERGKRVIDSRTNCSINGLLKGILNAE